MVIKTAIEELRECLNRSLELIEQLECRADHDTLGRWIAECTVRDTSARVSVTEALDLFNAWCRYHDLGEWKGKGFSNAMTERGFRKTKSDVMFFEDLRLVGFRQD